MSRYSFFRVLSQPTQKFYFGIRGCSSSPSGVLNPNRLLVLPIFSLALPVMTFSSRWWSRKKRADGLQASTLVFAMRNTDDEAAAPAVAGGDGVLRQQDALHGPLSLSAIENAAEEAPTPAAGGDGFLQQENAIQPPPSISTTENSDASGSILRLEDEVQALVTSRMEDSQAEAAAGRGGGSDIVRFRVSDSVKLVLHRGDITNWFVDGKSDAIVNAANPRMLGGGGVDGAIHRRAGRALMEACRKVPQVSPDVRCPTGEARVTKGFRLPVSRIVHAVGPVYSKYDNSAELLGAAYRNSVKAAVKEGIKYIAFPAISCGVYGYPLSEAAEVSLSEIKASSEGLSEVHFVFFEQKTYFAWLHVAGKQFDEI